MAIRFIRVGLGGPCRTVRVFVAFYLGIQGMAEYLPDAGFAL